MSVKRSTCASCCLFAIHLLYVYVSLSFLLAIVVFSQPFLFLLWLVDILPPPSPTTPRVSFSVRRPTAVSPLSRTIATLLFWFSTGFSFKTDSDMLWYFGLIISVPITILPHAPFPGNRFTLLCSHDKRRNITFVNYAFNRARPTVLYLHSCDWFLVNPCATYCI